MAIGVVVAIDAGLSRLADDLDVETEGSFGEFGVAGDVEQTSEVTEDAVGVEGESGGPPQDLWTLSTGRGAADGSLTSMTQLASSTAEPLASQRATTRSTKSSTLVLRSPAWGKRVHLSKMAR